MLKLVDLGGPSILKPLVHALRLGKAFGDDTVDSATESGHRGIPGFTCEVGRGRPVAGII